MAPGTVIGSAGNGAFGGLAARERTDGRSIEHAVIHADVLEVAATQEVVAALHLVGRHHPPGQAELVQRGIVIAAGLHTRHLAAIDEQAYTLVFVPGKGQVQPLVRTWRRVHAERHARAGEVGIGDERIETMPVPVDAQPGHVPATVVGIADAEDHERCFAHRVARAPVEGEGATLGEDVAGCIPGQHAVVLPLDGLAARSVVDDVDLVAEVRHRLTLRHHGLKAFAGIDMEQQRGRIGSGHRGAGSQGHRQQQAAGQGRAVRHQAFPFNGRRPARAAGP